jgi:GTP-binding protein
VYETWNSRIPTSELNRWIAYMTERHPPPMGTHGKRLRIRYATQAKARPPTFALFVSKPDNLPDSYLRFLENGLREDFGLDGVPIRMVMRKPKNPFVS